MSRREKWTNLDDDQRFDFIADDLDSLEAAGKERNARVTQLMVTAVALLIAVSTGIITFVAVGR